MPLWLGLLSFQFLANAAELSEDFSSRLQRSSGSLVWNQKTGQIHPPLEIQEYTLNAGPLLYRDILVGDGSDGPFNSSTYSNFGTLVGNNLYINIGSGDELNVTEFTLDAGVHLYPVGNGSLIIRSLGDVTINGVIHCEGEDGDDNSVASPQGGQGRCGGGNGGSGGAVGLDGEPGTRNNTVVGVGQAGAGGVTGGGGGGAGGAFSDNPEIDGNQGGANDGGLGGVSGINSPNHDFSILGAAAGGGGGGGGSFDVGAGGGGGGGQVLIYAVGDVSIGTQGLILADGGDGGAAAGDGGGGGPGGGGSIQIFSGGVFSIFNDNSGNPAISAYGGQQGLAALSGDSGVAAFGRIWVAHLTGGFGGTGYYFPPEDVSLSPGEVGYKIGAFDLETKSYDLLSTLPEPTSVTVSPASGAVAIELAGSTDNFILSDTGFLPSGQIADLMLMRYLKFKLTVTNADNKNPILIDTLSLNYEKGLQTEFNFNSQAAGCGSISTSGDNKRVFLFLLLWLIPLFVLRTLKSQAKT